MCPSQGGAGAQDVKGDTMRRFDWRRAGVVGLLVLVAVAGLFWAVKSRHRGDALKVMGGAGAKPGAEGEESTSEEYVVVGGVRRRASDIEPAKRPPQIAKNDEPRDYGKFPPVDPEANEQTKSVASALREENHPERISALVRPARFDTQAFKADPQTYLNTVEPGRVFQSAQPAPGTPKLYTASPGRQHIRQGTKAPLRVVVPPGSPATFTAFDGGVFSNKLNSITVQASPQGIAEAEFTATPGTIANVHILASSPVASGRARFVVNVLPADDAPAVADAR